MAYYRYDIVSYDGNTSISTNSAGDYNAYFEDEGDPLGTYQMSPVVAEIARQHPMYAQSSPQGKTFGLTIEMRDTDQTKLDALKAIFALDQRPRVLKIADGSSVQRQLNVVSLGLRRVLPNVFTVALFAARPVWENASVEVITKTAQGSSSRWTDVNNAGNAHAKPTVALTLTSAGSIANGKTLMRYAVVANRSPYALQDANGNPWPIDITNGGWDVETEIKANRMHPQGYDLLVFVNGVPANRWLSNFGAGYGQVGDHAPVGGWRSYESGAIAYHAQPFVLPGCSERETNNVDEAGFWLIRVNPGVALGGSMKLRIRVDNGGVPGALVSANSDSATVLASSVGTGSAAYVAFTWASPPGDGGASAGLKARTRYWLELDCSAVTGMGTSDYIRISKALASTALGSESYEGEIVNVVKHSTDETTWTQPHASETTGAAVFRVYTTGNAKIWVPMLLDPMVKRTIDRGMIASGSPAIKVNDADGLAMLPDRFAAIIDNECIVMQKRAGTTHEAFPVKTAARGTTAANHLTGTSMFWAQPDIRVMFGHVPSTDNAAALIKTPYEPDPLAPVIDGKNSTNNEWWWIGPFAAFGEEIRPGAWRVEQDDSVDNYATVTMDGDPAADDVNITFKDAAPAGSYIMRNVATQNFPVGIKGPPATNVVTLDATPIPTSLSVQHLMTNARGEEEKITTWRNPDAGTAKQFSINDESYRYRIRVVNDTVVGAEASGGADVAIVSATPQAQTFTLDYDTDFMAFAVKLKKHASAASDLSIDLYAVNDDDDESVDTSVKLMPTQTVTAASLTTSFATVAKTISPTVKLPAGKYAFAFTTSDSNGYYVQRSDGSVYSGGEMRQGGQVSVAIDSDYDAHSDGTTLTENDTGNGPLIDDSPLTRAAIRWPLSIIPSGSTVAAVQVRFEVSVSPGATCTMGWAGYETNGQRDPDVDNASDLRNYAASGTSYLSDTTSGDTTGIKTVTLGAPAATDVQNAKATVNRFSVGVRQSGTGALNFYGNAHASKPAPALIVTYTPPSTSAYVTKLGSDAWFRVYGSPSSILAPTGTGDSLDLDNIKVTFDNTTPTTPFVAFGAANVACWLVDGDLVNLSNKRETGMYLAEALNATDGTFDVTSIAPEVAEAQAAAETFAGVIQIESEKMLPSIPLKADYRQAQISVTTRGAYGTSNVSHSQGLPIYLLHQRVSLLTPITAVAGEATITVDFENMTVKSADPHLADPFVPAIIADMDEVDPFTVAPGANELMLTDLGTWTVVVTYREPWA